MSKSTTYNTRQRELILSFLRGNGDAHVRAADIAEHLAASGSRVGVATVYRTLDRLTKSGQLRRFTEHDGGGACYQYVDAPCVSEHYHLRCTGCGALIHLDCDMVGELERHITEKHGFTLDPCRTVFYGICASCRENSDANGCCDDACGCHDDAGDCHGDSRDCRVASDSGHGGSGNTCGCASDKSGGDSKDTTMIRG